MHAPYPSHLEAIKVSIHINPYKVLYIKWAQGAHSICLYPLEKNEGIGVVDLYRCVLCWGMSRMRNVCHSDANSQCNHSDYYS